MMSSENFRKIERELRERAEETKDGNEVSAVHAIVASGELEAIKNVIGFKDDREDDRGRERDDDDDDQDSGRVVTGRVVLKMSRKAVGLDEFSYEKKEEEGRSNEEENDDDCGGGATESLMNQIGYDSKGWESAQTASEFSTRHNKDSQQQQPSEMKSTSVVGKEHSKEEEEEEEEEDKATQKYDNELDNNNGRFAIDTPTHTTNNNNSIGQSRNDLFRASGISGGLEDATDPQGTQRIEPDPNFVDNDEENEVVIVVEEELDVNGIVAQRRPESFNNQEEEEVVVVAALAPTIITIQPIATTTMILATQEDNREEEEEEEDSENEEEEEILGTQVFALEEEEEEEEEREKTTLEDTAAEKDIEEKEEAIIHQTPANAMTNNEHPPPLQPRRPAAAAAAAAAVAAATAFIPSTELNELQSSLAAGLVTDAGVIPSTSLTQNIPATAPSGNADVQIVAFAAENAVRNQLERRRMTTMAFGNAEGSIAPQSVTENPNSNEEKTQLEVNNGAIDHVNKSIYDDDEEDGEEKDDEIDDDDAHNQSPDLAYHYSQRVLASDDDNEEGEEEEDYKQQHRAYDDDEMYRSQLTQQDDEGGILHRPANVKFKMPVAFGDGEVSSEEEDGDDDGNNKKLESEQEEEDEEEEDEEEEDEEEKDVGGRGKRKRIPVKFFDDTQKEEEIDEDEEEVEEEEESQPLPAVSTRPTRNKSKKVQEQQAPAADTTSTPKIVKEIASTTKSSKYETWEDYLAGCPKCRYSSCNTCRPMHILAINGDESAQGKVIRWNENRGEKMTLASRSLQQAKSSKNKRMRRTSSVNATARTIKLFSPRPASVTKSNKRGRKSTATMTENIASLEDSAEKKRKSIKGGLFSGLSFMISGMPEDSRKGIEMRKAIRENGGVILNSIPKFNKSKKIDPNKQIVLLPSDPKETAKCLFARAIGARLRSVQWVRNCLSKKRVLLEDKENPKNLVAMDFEGTSYILLGNKNFQEEFSNLMLHARAGKVISCGTDSDCKEDWKLKLGEDIVVAAVVIQTGERLPRWLKSALKGKTLVRHDWLTESFRHMEILPYFDYELQPKAI